MPLIRYPGSKEKLIDDLWLLFPDSITEPLWSWHERHEYREPFFGSGAIGFRVLKRLDKNCVVWLNDIDPDLVCLWQAVKDTPRPLCRLVTNFTPSVDAFYDFKARDGKEDCDPVERGFRKLALHRMSVSGFGFKSGGPIGGRNQTGDYSVDCRWSPERIKVDALRLNELLNKFADCRITNGDFEPMIREADERTFIYLDPPYYEKGGQLYKFAMSEADHLRLCESLQSTSAAWVLSYDDHSRIRELYSWAKFHTLKTTYSNAVCKADKRPKNREVAIAKAS